MIHRSRTLTTLAIGTIPARASIRATLRVGTLGREGVTRILNEIAEPFVARTHAGVHAAFEIPHVLIVHVDPNGGAKSRREHFGYVASGRNLKYGGHDRFSSFANVRTFNQNGNVVALGSEAANLDLLVEPLLFGETHDGRGNGTWGDKGLLTS